MMDEDEGKKIEEEIEENQKDISSCHETHGKSCRVENAIEAVS